MAPAVPSSAAKYRAEAGWQTRYVDPFYSPSQLLTELPSNVTGLHCESDSANSILLAECGDE